MAGFKRKKEVKQKEMPREKFIAQGGNPEQYYSQKPVWAFASSDQEVWAFTKENVGETFWNEIFPKMRAFETQTWSEILKNKKNNHSVDLSCLNKDAQDRLAAKCIEAESLISLRLSGKHRLYGYMTGNVFNLIWYDDDHGDNKTCVCRSHLKHT